MRVHILPHFLAAPRRRDEVDDLVVLVEAAALPVALNLLLSCRELYGNFARSRFEAAGPAVGMFEPRLPDRFAGLL